jgi:two-component system, OmpR family, phosphate regulon response regulator PhoB
VTSLLLVEDDLQLGKTLSSQLTDQGYKVHWCQTVVSYKELNEQDFDLAIVDLNLPDGSGFDVIAKLNIPVIIMTAQNSPENRLQGLELGVYDFIPKPFLFKELHLKLSRLLSERQQTIDLEGRLQIDLKSRTIEDQKGNTTFLNEREYQILKLLIEKTPQVVSRDEILNFLKEDESASHRSIDNVIVRLRQVLEDENHKYIHSVRGVGYQWLGEKK